MLLFVTGPRVAEESHARKIYAEIAAAWPRLAGRRLHPRTGLPLVPVVTRLDLFLCAFSPAPGPGESGLAFEVPPREQWFRWVPALRGPLRDLITVSFPPGPRYQAPFDPLGPSLADSQAGERAHLRTLSPEFREPGDPAQRATDPRLWLVLSPPLPGELETAILSTFLRAEPFARIARLADESVPAGWLEEEVDGLAAGKGLATEGLVVDLEGPAGAPSVTDAEEGGTVRTRSVLFDLVSALQDLYATKETLEPGEVYNRMHSHLGSEELYVVLEGEGVIRVNERALPIEAGQCFGKPRGFGCSTQILNTGPGRMVFLDVGTSNTREVDLCHYPDHGELMARFGGHRWLVPTEAIFPGSELASLYDRRYVRTAGKADARGEDRPCPEPATGARAGDTRKEEEDE